MGVIFRINRDRVIFSAAAVFFNSVTGILGLLTLSVCGTWIIFGICMWIGHFCGRKWSIRLILALYMFSALWMKLPVIQILPLTGFNHLLILHHNLGSHCRLTVTGITLLIIAIIITATVRFGRQGYRFFQRRRISGIVTYYIRELATRQNVRILCGVVLIITLYKETGQLQGKSGQEWIYSLFAGHGTGGFRVFAFLEMMITIGAPLYLLAVFVEQTVSGQSLFISVRTKSRRTLMRGILSTGIIFLAAICFCGLQRDFLEHFSLGKERGSQYGKCCCMLFF